MLCFFFFFFFSSRRRHTRFSRDWSSDVCSSDLWRLRNVSDGYTMIDTGAGSGINGGIGRSSDGTPWVSFYVAADDPQATLDRAVSLGGTMVVPVTEIPNAGTFAMFNDPDGNIVGIINLGGTAGGPPSEGDGVAVDWFEVLGSDAERTQRFD